MNISEKYSKQQLDRSAYISEDKYKKAFDLNRIRLAVYKVTGSSSRFSYYYTEYLFFYLLERLHALGIVTTFNRGLFEYIDSMEVISKDDDEEQLKTAENDWGTEVIDRIIDEVTGDDDLGDYEDPPEDEAKKAAEEAASDDSGSGEFKLPWEIDKPGAPTPPSVITETAKGTLEETAKNPDAPNTPKGDTDVFGMTKEDGKGAIISITSPKGDIQDVPIGRGTGEGDTVNIWYDPDSGDIVVVITHPGEDTANPNDMKAAAEEGRTQTLPLGPGVTTTVNDGTNTVTYSNPEGWEVSLTCVTSCDAYAACGGDSSTMTTCDMPGCDTPTCDEPTCDCDCDCDCCDADCDCDCDCCDADCDCDCDCCVNDCDCDCDTPCDCDCSEDSSCSSDCNDCCIGDGGCSSDAGCACDCCVNDCDCCIGDDCDCDTWCDWDCDSWDS